MPTSSVPIDVVYFEEPAAHKAEDYLKAYKGHVYSAISLIAQLCSTIEINLYRRLADGDVEKVDSHPAIDALWYTNEWMTWQQLREVHQIYYELVGEAVWVLLRAGDTISEIVPLRPDWVSLMPDGKGGIKYYEYTIGGKGKSIKLDPDDVLFDKDYDPLNMYRGLGKVKPASVPIDIDDYSNIWNRNFFFNSAMPSLILSTEQQLSPESKRRLARKFQATHGGVRNAHKVAFMDGGQLKVDQISTSMQELDFQASKNRLMEEILSVFHMSKANLGITDDVNLANAEVQERRLMKMVIKPRLIHFVGFINEFYLPKFTTDDDIFFNFEEPVSEDMNQKVALLTAASNGGWLTTNEIREELGYDALDSGGDDIYKPFSMQVMGTEREMPAVPEEEQRGLIDRVKRGVANIAKRLPRKKFVPRKTLRTRLAAPIPPLNSKRQAMTQVQKEIKHDIKRLIIDLMKNGSVKDDIVVTTMTGEEKDAYWKAFVAKSDIKESVLKKLILEEAHRQEEIVLNKMKAHRLALDKKQKLQPSTFMFSVRDENKKFAAATRPFFAKTIRNTGEDEIRKLTPERMAQGMTKQVFDMTTAEIEEYLDSLGFEYGLINEETRQKLIAALAEGINDGLGYEELAKNVTEVYDEYEDYRAQRIARTETLRTLNFSTLQAYKQSGVVSAKEWLTARDERVRIAHQEVDGKVVPLNKPFMVDGEPMMAPQDASASPGNTVNCRCTMLPVVESTYMAMQEISRKDNKMHVEELLSQVAKQLADKKLRETAVKVAEQKEEAEMIANQVAEEKKKAEEAKAEKEKQVAEKKKEKAEAALHKAKKVKAKKELEKTVEKKRLAEIHVNEERQKAVEIIETAEKDAEKTRKAVKKEMVELRDSVTKALTEKK
jgi:HK97 family phage portal protein